MRGPCLASITLDAKGGGVAAVSRLLWNVFDDRWPGVARLVTLLDADAARDSLESSPVTRLRFGAQMASLQAGRHCDWIMCSHLSVAKVQAFVPAPIRRPYAVFLHGIEAWRALTSTQEWALKGASLRVANSAFTARRVAAMHPTIGSIAPCPLALPPDWHHLTDNGELVFDIGPRTVIVVARMAASERYKGHDELLEVWPTVLQRVPDARLMFVGDGDDVPRLKGKAGALGVSEATVFTGFVSEPELRTLYRRSAAFAMPSSAEGFGLVYLEAMSHRLPCIGSTDDAASEIIVDGETGFLVRQSDRGALADRIVRLLTEESLRVAMGGAGHQRVREHFSYQTFSDRVLSLIESTLTTSLPAWGPSTAQ